jgi:hypothetical protein
LARRGDVVADREYPVAAPDATGKYNGVLENQSDPIAMVYFSKHEGIHV